MSANFIAIDLGASSGRVLLGKFDGERFALEELHRFPNGPANVGGRLYWDVLRLWEEMKTGLATYSSRFSDPVAGIGVDTWGVDYALLDEQGKLLGNPLHYRDTLTRGGIERACAVVPREEIYKVTGIQFLELNTLIQLHSRLEQNDPHLQYADTLLMMPDLFTYWLSGVKTAEYTEATTTQLVDAKSRDWATGLLKRFGLPAHVLPPITPPGTNVGTLLPDVAREVGLAASTPIILPASHDTGSAVAGVPHLDENSVYLSSGTWSLIGVETSEPILTETMRRFNLTNEGGVGGTVRVLKNVAGMWLLEESRRQWAREGQEYDWATLLSLATRAEPFRSFIDPDEGRFNTPGDLPGRVRAYCRETGQAEPQDEGSLARAYLESLALKYRSVVEQLEHVTGRKLDTIRVVGGGSQNALLNQFTADASNKRVVAGPVEATALGNIMVQAVATGHLADIRQGREAIANSVELETFEPRNVSGWDEAYRRSNLLLDATI